MPVQPGDILRGKYRIDSLIGRGGMGNVFAATDTERHENVAIKVVSRQTVDDVLMVRMHREAEAAARIRSDYVPRVLEVADTDDGETFLVMERLVGESLSMRIKNHGQLAWGEISRIAEDILRGLIDAHTAGVVHRDLKPSNVFLAARGGRLRAMVLDFGVCKLDGVDVERLTGTGESIGTVAFMAPEQIRGAAKVDERADLYAFGVLVFELLTGRLPHDGPSQMAILASKLENPPAKLEAHARVPMPEGTAELVARALSREPEGRFSSAQELLKAWRRLSKATIVETPTPPPLAARSQDDAPTEVIRSTMGRPGALPVEAFPTQMALTATSIRRPGQTRLAMGLAACGLVVGAGVVAFAVLRGPEHEGPSPAAAASVTSAASADLSDPIVAPIPVTSPQDLEDDADAGSVAPQVPGGEPVPRRRVRRVTPRSSGPHITSQPRY